jgi:hypothetical protein
MRLEDRLERLRVAGRPGAFVAEVIDFLEVDQDRHAQIGGRAHTFGGIRDHRRQRGNFISPNPCAPSLTAWVNTCSASGLLTS